MDKRRSFTQQCMDKRLSFSRVYVFVGRSGPRLESEYNECSENTSRVNEEIRKENPAATFTGFSLLRTRLNKTLSVVHARNIKQQWGVPL